MAGIAAVPLMSIFALPQSTAFGVSKWWDVNTTNPGSGQTTGAGTWSSGAVDWNTDSTGANGGALSGWTGGVADAAFFSAGTDGTSAFTVTLSSALSAQSLNIEEGTVNIGAGSALTTQTITVASGAKLSYVSSGQFVATAGATMTLNGGTFECTTSGVGGTFLTSNMGIVLGTGGGTLSVTTGAPSIYSGVISGSSLTVTGGSTGVLAITSTETYTGATTINGGTLRLRTGPGQLPSATTLQINSPGSFDPATFGQTVATLNGDGKVAFSGASTLTVNGTAASNFTGVISDGASHGSLTKAGTGVMTLGGLNTYQGTFALSAGTVTVSSGGSLCGAICDVRINTGTLNLNNTAQTVEQLTGNSGGIINLGIGHTLTVAPDVATMTYAGTIGGSGTIIYNGNAQGNNTVWDLTAANSWNGGLTVNSGTIRVNNNAALGAINSPLTLGDGTTISTTGTARQITYAGTISGNITIGQATGGTAALGIGGTVNLNAGTRTLTIANVLDTISGVISNGGLSVAAAAASNTLVLSGTNLFDGSLTVQNNAIVKVSNVNGMGTTVGGTTVNSGGELTTIFSGTVGEPLTLNGTGISSAGALLLNGSASIWTGPVTLGSSGVRINNTSTASTFTGGITGSGNNLTIGGTGGVVVKTTGLSIGTGTLTYDGTTTLTLAAPNTVGVVSETTAGNISVGDAGALGDTASNTVIGANAGSTSQLSFVGVNFTIAEPMTIAGSGGSFNSVTGDITASSISTVNLSGPITLADNAAVAAAGTSTLIFSNAAAFTAVDKNLTLGGGTAASTVSGAISLGAGQLIKIAGGTWVLTGSNSYTGMTMIGTGASAGVLRATDGIGIPTTSNVNINGGVWQSPVNILRVPGTAANQIQISGGASGFSAFGSDIAVDLGGNGSHTGGQVVWGSGTFNPTTFTIDPNSTDNAVDFQNPIDLAGSLRTVSVGAFGNTGGTATLSGAITDSGSGGGLIKTSGGTLILSSTANTYDGDTTVSAGTLQISDSANLGSPTNGVTLKATGTLQAAGTIVSTRNITLAGTTTGVTIDTAGNAVTFGNVDGVGNLTKLNTGTLVVNHVISTGGLTIGAASTNGGVVQIAPSGGANGGTSVLASVTVPLTATTGQLDLTDNHLIVNTAGSLGTLTGTTYSNVQGLIQSGLNGGGWNGKGIVTSQTNASSTKLLTTLGSDTAGDLGVSTFGGQSVNTTDTLVMYTYAGDANLTGHIDGDDYSRIDAGFGSGGTLTGYANGDFNYDGKINADDYFLIDRNYVMQGSPLPASPPLGGLAGVSAVPEPTSLGAIGVAALMLGRRRRRAK